MTSFYEILENPTRLYIKQCPHCGLKYFGKTVSEDIKGYTGSGADWKKHLSEHNVKPLHLWNSDWYYDKSIVRFATKFSVINKIIEREEWANLQIEDGLGTGAKKSESVKIKISQTVSKTKSSLEWKQNTGLKQGEKISQIKNDPNWKITTGVETSKKISDTKTGTEWKSTVGLQANKKRAETRSDTAWKDTVGREGYSKAAEKNSATRSSPEWKLKRHKTCNYCGWYGDPANYARYHDEKCKSKEKEA